MSGSQLPGHPKPSRAPGAGAGHARYSELRLPGRWRGFTFLHHDPLRKRKDAGAVLDGEGEGIGRLWKTWCDQSAITTELLYSKVFCLARLSKTLIREKTALSRMQVRFSLV